MTEGRAVTHGHISLLTTIVTPAFAQAPFSHGAQLKHGHVGMQYSRWGSGKGASAS